MSKILEEVRHEIIDLHDFFVMWFNGTVERDQLDTSVLSRFHSDFRFIPPDGNVLTRDNLAVGFQQAYGSNKNLRIQVRDVEVRHEMGNYVLATYTEWQTGSARSEQANNARFTTALIEVGNPMLWLHTQETWLPDEVCAAGSFEF